MPARNDTRPRQGRSAFAVLLVVLVLTAACVTDPESDLQADAAAGGSGGASSGGSGGGTTCPPATGGTGGQTIATTPVCTMPAKWLGVLTKPSPLVSVGRPVMTNSTEQTNKVKYSGDGVHPQSPEARTAINQAYANALLPLYPSH